MRILDLLAEKIASHFKKETQTYYWMTTLQTVCKDKEDKTMYCRWFSVSEGTEPIYPYCAMLKEYLVRYGKVPTIISVVRISKEDYEEVFKK